MKIGSTFLSRRKYIEFCLSVTQLFFSKEHILAPVPMTIGVTFLPVRLWWIKWHIPIYRGRKYINKIHFYQNFYSLSRLKFLAKKEQNLKNLPNSNKIYKNSLIIPNKLIITPNKPIIIPHKTLIIPSKTIIIPNKMLVIPNESIIIPYKTIIIPNKSLIIPNKTIIIPHKTSKIPNL